MLKKTLSFLIIMSVVKINIISLFVLILIPFHSYAYIGPGMTGGFLAATFGIIIGLVSLIIGIIYFPIKRFIKRKKLKRLDKR
jgi:hypothetical protein